MEKKWEKIGEKKGEYKKAVETAQNMLRLKADIDFIHQTTGLSLSEIKKIMESEK